MSEVYKAIIAVASDIAKAGISKDNTNTQQKYTFRGIDDVYNAMAPLISKHGLCIFPKVLNRDCVERTTKSGGVLFYVTVMIEYTFVAEDGSSHVAVVAGEAMDSGDKATNKAMSAAYKYLCMQTFCIPTKGDNDADATTHEPTAYISEDQVKRLREGLLFVGMADDEFCKTARVDAVEKLEASRFDNTMKWLQSKAEK